MTLFYITRDVERAAGLLGTSTDVFVVTNTSPLAEALANKFGSQLSVMSGQGGLSTHELMRNEETRKKIRELSKAEQPNILVFKTSPQIEKVCEKNSWKLLNPPHKAGAVLEEKIGQWRWLQSVVMEEGKRKKEDGVNGINPKFNLVLPQVWVGKMAERTYGELVRELGEGPIVQFNRGHTGLGTFRLDDDRQWKELQERFSRREVKASRFYEGKAYTVNAVVISQKPKAKSQKYGVTAGHFQIPDSRFQVHVGNISEQLTGIPGCTNNPYATVGNDWSAGGQLPEEIKNTIHACAETVGTALAERGYCGLFGIDVIVTDNGETILIEVNPRQSASATMESQLQRERGEASVMEWHISALLEARSSKLKAQNVSVFSKTLQPSASRLALPAKRVSLQPPIVGFQLFFRNIEPRPAIVANEFIPGRYRLGARGLELAAQAVSVGEVQMGEFFAFSSGKNSPVSPGGEILRIQSKSGMIDAFGNDYKRAISLTRRSLLP